MSEVSSIDLQKAIAEEIRIFLAANRELIIKRAMEKIKAQGKDGAPTK